ncbi:MAG: aminotransferase class I/II-fold pyridoxal phosphate-dependent enzyme [Meiothermus sp.]|uniref:trans-sulfuration enzyme family protein n=1 Tax=Meiothermus sp. TaxID=1955249 RepID=UPI0025D747B5|nr:aminotransferase class I/II-fold pyridoxal phosphate-dependent enzyme [Meiothermus sp.]MCS7058838.1 aminotransferase class I/II-fold pyridoxal phosphate-dependent enzyme [Meiothermus sp.]MCS7194062.1 aminotransferase class I/II-fold pyridoxal phosphate-dependent enzyme [Meiothermus sp.]MDW8091163.1 aminotransferase class I/II-fold pyridoxal phosphate-dependent enzyme [Meiothermus sp.]MDW8480460.1 aminotransferase class I/II-fold pyridoxal phosphate-dependent enzyme [Meiothermus sp.]
MRSHLKAASWLVAAGRPEGPGVPLNTPLVPASNFVRGAERIYARSDGTPTWEALEDILGGLEGGEAVAFASGMAAVAAVFDLLPAGARVVLPQDCYQGVVALAEAGALRGRWRVERIPLEDTAAWEQACAGADLLWLESPSNPLLRLADLAAICAAPRKPGGILAVDNTFATPLNQQPLALGASLVVHSATKLIGGHSDLLAGVVVARDTALAQALRKVRELVGAVPGTLEAFLAVRGVRTLALRLERAQQNAQELALRLAQHPRVARVHYPGLPSHPQHALARRSLRGFGTIVSFELRGGAAAADALCTRVRLIRHATSLGGVESSLERRSALPGQAHLPPSLVRLSVGIEDVEDLWADLEAALG